MRPYLCTLLLIAAACLPWPVHAQLLDVRVWTADAKPRILAFFPGGRDSGELVLHDEAGHRLLSRKLPFLPRAVCMGPDAGFVAAPAAGGLVFLDERMLMKIRLDGYAYESLACTADAVYAAGRTTRIHRFDFPTLLNRRILAETNSFNPRVLATPAALAAISWDGSVVIISANTRPRRVYLGRHSLTGLTPGPRDSWITLAENNRISILGPGGIETHRFQVEDARLMASSPQGTLAVLTNDNTVFFYRPAGAIWVRIRRRAQLDPALKPVAMSHLSGPRWVVLTPNGIAFFDEPT